jgi:hypothetical protein
MARKEMKYNLDEIIKKIQLGTQLTKDEEVFYLVEGIGMKKKEAERTVYLGEHHEESGVLRD